jgi:hypothetical protein
MDLAAFNARFPEFRTATPELKQSVLDAAAAELNADAFGDAFNEAHGLLTAHKLGMSPFGQQARMVNEKGSTTYAVLFSEVCRRAVVSLQVI